MDAQEIYKVQLEHAYEAIAQIYSTATNWAGVLLAAEALLLGLSLEQLNPLFICLGGVALLILAYLVHRAGQTIGALVAVVFALEARFGVASAYSLGNAFIGSFRPKAYVQSLRALSAEMSDDQVMDWLSKRAGYSLFHYRRSRTARVLTLIGIIQILLALIWSLISTFFWLRAMNIP